MFSRREVIANQSFTLLFGYCDLDLDLHIQTSPVFPGDMNFLCQGFQKLSSDRQTYRYMDRTKIIHYAASWVVKNANATEMFQLLTRQIN